MTTPSLMCPNDAFTWYKENDPRLRSTVVGVACHSESFAEVICVAHPEKAAVPC